jgi:hypothetical protein
MTEQKDWDNNDSASPVLHFDLTMADIRNRLVLAIEEKDEILRLQHLNLAHEYVRGLSDGNRFMRQKPILQRG